MRRLDAPAGWRWLFAVRQALGVHRAEIDALNVFPVPDGDTGTNLYLTWSTALERLLERGAEPADPRLSQATDALVREALLAARGNSGVILSQFLRGVAEGIRADAEADRLGLGGPGLAAVLDLGRRRAREGVSDPVEGTILTVADDAALAAASAADAGADLGGVVEAALDGARASLARTPERLPLLRRAGVVDAGGAGLVVILATLVEVVTGRRVDLGRMGPPEPATLPHLLDERAYEVMYVVRGLDVAAREALRDSLLGLGDAVVLAGDEAVATVHVHTDEPGAAIEVGCDVGRPEGIRVTWLGATGEQEPRPDRRSPALDRARTGVIACASGPNLSAVMASLGAHVVTSSPGRRATTGELLAAREGLRAGTVILLANHDDTLLAAEAAGRLAREAGLPTLVVPSRSAVAGLSALALFDPDADPDDLAQRMIEATRACRSGLIVRATRHATTAAGACAPGAVVAYAGKEAIGIGDDPDELADELVRALIGDGADLVTLVSGGSVGSRLARGVAARLKVAYPEVEVCRIEGDPIAYDLLVGVE